MFDSDGKFLRTIHIDIPPPPDAQPAIGNKPNLTNYLQTGGTMTPGAPGRSASRRRRTRCFTSPTLSRAASTSSALDGKVLGMFGRSGKQLKEFGWVHAIACPNENTLYVAEILNWRVQKLILHPDQQHPAKN